MRINEIVVESTLNEGPFGAIGRGVGNVIGGVAKGIGAVKGAVSGAVDRVKKDFAAGQKGAYDAVAGKPAAATATPPAAKPTSQTQTLANPKSPPDAGAATPPAGAPAATPPDAGAPPATPAGAGAPAATPPDAGAGAPAATPPDAGAATPPAGAGAPPAAPAATPSKAPAAADEPPPEPPAAAAPVADPAYDKAQKAVEALPPEQKKEIIGLLQADAEVKAAMAEPAPPQNKKGVSQPGKPTFTGVPEKPGAAAKKPVYTPPTDPEEIADMKKRGFDPATGKKPTADADRFAKSIVQPLQKAQQNASRVNSGTALSEALAQRVAHHKQNMFETQLIKGTQSIFRSHKNVDESLVQTAAPAAQPAIVKKNSALDMAAAFKQGWDGGGSSSRPAADTDDLVDASGSVPDDMMTQLEQLNKRQRIELYNSLVKLNP